MTQRIPSQQTPRTVTHDEAAQVLAEVEHAARLGAFIWHPSEAPIWSDGFYRMLGFTPGDSALMAASFYERVHPDDLTLLTASWERALRGETVALTYRIVRLDGVIRWVLGRCLPSADTHGRIVRILGTVEDVTEKQEADRKLAHAHEVLRDTQRAAGVGSLLYRVSTGEIEWSEELCRIVGVDPETVLTRKVTDSLAHPDDLEKQNAWMKRVLAGESMPPLLMRVLRSDGVTRYLETRASLVQLSTGTTVQGVSIDVTGRVEMEERLRHAAKMEAIGTLAAGIAHDFNNYLGVLTMHLDAIAEHVGDLDGTVRGARHAADQCSEFTRQLLTFARKQVTAPRETDVSTLLRDAGRLIQRLVGASIVVSLELPEYPLVTHADRGQLESALVNLAANARDAMPRGGKLSIAAKLVDLTRADPRLDRDCPAGSYVLIRMADSGTGIAAEHLPRIFEPYFSTKPVGQGSGLGLATAYGSVQQHQGFMRVESVVGQGTSFEVYLPASTRRPLEVMTPPAPPLETRPAVAGRVLLVEDVDPLRELAVRVVRRLGVDVIAAADGLAALEHVRSAAEPFDVVVTDLMMPGMTGGEMAEAISALWPTTRFVFMTGYVAQDILDALVDKHPGCVILRKPFRSHELSDVVRLFLTRRSAASP